MARAEWEILDPSIIRLWESVRKAASLLALEDGRVEVELRDVILAIEAAEEWTTNLFWVSAQISASMWAREVDEIESYVLSRGGEVARDAVVRKFNGRKYVELVQQLEALHAQGRVIEVPVDGKKRLRAVRYGEDK